jgi:hypothetical protein
MAAIFVIVVEVRAHQPDKMLPIKDDHMIEQLPSAAADPSLRDAILLSMITIIDVLMFKLFDGLICEGRLRDWNRPPCRLLCW